MGAFSVWMPSSRPKRPGLYYGSSAVRRLAGRSLTPDWIAKAGLLASDLTLSKQNSTILPSLARLGIDLDLYLMSPMPGGAAR